MNLFSIPPGVPFLDAIAAEWLRRSGEDPLSVARGLILLPTRRAARALAEAFLRAGNGRPLLLPRITALGALDEAPLTLTGALDLPPAITPARRLAMLSQLILARNGAGGAPRTADGAWRLAGELATLMDEAERSGIDLATTLPGAADAAFAAHWRQTLEFLEIVTRAWPAILETEGLVNPAARQVALLRAQAQAWQDEPPTHPVWAAGATGAIPAVADLLKVIAGLPDGRVVLPGLDSGMAEEAWQALEASHPQYGLRRLLIRMDATRADTQLWPGAAVEDGRALLLSRAMLPAKALATWRDDAAPVTVTGLCRLNAADQQEEAAAIALILRQALETKGRRTALVTPDRDLAGRVAAELGRYGVIADDSAGEPLAETPPAMFLRLLARAMADGLAPVPLLALLKHPLAAAGLATTDCRAATRELEREALRGPRPPPGITGLRRHLKEGDRTRAARDLLARLENCLDPLLRLFAAPDDRPTRPPGDLLAALVAAAEALAKTDATRGPAILWSGEEGEALAELLAEVTASLAGLPDEAPATLPGLLDAVLEGAVVRSRRALRGRDGGGRDGVEHPRIYIWGLLEARLQAVDVMVLGGLVEGVWPPATDPGPWLSRPMRAAIGLPSPEEAVGQAAHDFCGAACAAAEVVLSCPRRRDGAPAVPARWLARLDAYLDARGMALSTHHAAEWARALDQPTDGAQPVAAPRPMPRVDLRPRRFSVTEIETWVRDPFAIYARHVLRLRALDPLDAEQDVLDYGTLVHGGLDDFIKAHGVTRDPQSAMQLREAMQARLLRAGLRDTLLAWWLPRIARIADWVIAEETRSDRLRPARIHSEAKGEWHLADRNFRLSGRADRIEQRADGSLALFDYKTGTPPKQPDVEAGRAPQLPLEAAMAAAGAFGPEIAGHVVELTYWHLTGGDNAGRVTSLFKANAGLTDNAVQAAIDGLRRLIVEYDDPAQPYLARPFPGAAPRFSDYVQLARVAEWSGSGEDE